MTKAAQRAKPGRKPIAGDAMPTLQVRLPVRMLERIDALCSSRLDAPDRSTVIRELLAEAIAARDRRA